MPKRTDISRVLVIGSGPIIIGQAAEFDYSGTQACRALREEGLEVILVNSNPATVMTDEDTADRVYIEPLTAEFVTRIIDHDRPDALLPTLGGQVGLNLALELVENGTLDRYGVEVIGTSPETIQRGEDREQFRNLMHAIGEPVPRGTIARNPGEALAFADSVGLPLIVRPAYTLGGTGGGIARTVDDLLPMTKRGIDASPAGQVLLEESVLGWKEIEFEVLRDGVDNCIAVCAMENIDPMGIHTGDSVVVAPTQTLTHDELQKLRGAAVRIVRALGVEGGCNVQFALKPDGSEYRVIEVNPRLSRSSALASKATGYPIAKMAARVALGLALDEIRNPVTGSTVALFEPSLDYVVVKMPRWPFDKFTQADRHLGTQMKATGEVMAIDRTLEGALQKAVRSLEIGLDGLGWPGSDALADRALMDRIAREDDRRLFFIGEALRRGHGVKEIADITGIDRFFLDRIDNIISLEEQISRCGIAEDSMLLRAKKMGFSDSRLAHLCGERLEEIRRRRKALGIIPTYKMVDTCAGEFEAVTPYYYSTYEDESEVQVGEKPGVIVLGSGPIRIGQGIEFDYCSVHAVRVLKEMGYEAIIINNNPETVSTDFDTADRLYFEPLSLEDVLNIVDIEQPVGVVTQFGGQTAVNLAGPLEAAGVPILGTSSDDIDRSETRERFDALLDGLQISRPRGQAAESESAARNIASQVGYPVMVRPSYVLGGRGMQVVSDDVELSKYLAMAVQVTPDKPIWIDHYVSGMELEIDAVSDGQTVLIPGIMQHVERAGVHSGDSIAVFPAQNLPPEVVSEVEDVTIKISRSLGIRGIINLQMVYDGEALHILEVNPRSSRTVPFLAKASGVPVMPLATGAAAGQSLSSAGWRTGMLPTPGQISVKIPVFSWNKLPGVDAGLGPEMGSTGEVMASGHSTEEALSKGLIAAGMNLPEPGEGVLLTIADRDKPQAATLARRLDALGYSLYATSGTRVALQGAGLDSIELGRLSDNPPNVISAIEAGTVSMVINSVTHGRRPERDGFRIRRAAVERGLPCFTSLDTAEAVVRVLSLRWATGEHHHSVMALQDMRNQ